MISCICIAISGSGNANSQVRKPKALMRWFSQLISVFLCGFDVNAQITSPRCKLQEHIWKIVIANLISEFLISNCKCRRYNVRQSKRNCWEVGGFNCSGDTPWSTKRYICVIQLGTLGFLQMHNKNNCWHWMIRLRHIFVYPPHVQGRVAIWPLLHSAKNSCKRKKKKKRCQI